jgi:hypothetical protein
MGRLRIDRARGGIMNSRFDDLLKNAKRAPAPAEGLPDDASASIARQGTTPARPSPAPSEAPAPRRMGRPPGKKSDPAFEQVTAYVPRELYGKVRGVLWNDHSRKEFSELVTELLSGWLEDQHAR